MNVDNIPHSWSYRTIYDGTNYWVGEVYYDEAGTPISYTAASEDTLQWDDLNDLWRTVEHIATDAARPVIRVDPKTEKILGEMR